MNRTRLPEVYARLISFRPLRGAQGMQHQQNGSIVVFIFEQDRSNKRHPVLKGG